MKILKQIKFTIKYQNHNLVCHLRNEKKQFLENNDIKPEDFIENPKSIMPHFLVPDHPLSKRLLEEDKLTKQLGFDKYQLETRNEFQDRPELAKLDIFN